MLLRPRKCMTHRHTPYLKIQSCLLTDQPCQAIENLGEIIGNVLRTQTKLQQTIDKLMKQGGSDSTS